MRIASWIAGALLAGVGGIGLARADVTGSYDGQISGKKLPQPVAAAATFSQTSKRITGTVAIGTGSAAYVGDYLVTGKATPKRIKVTGQSATGATLVWTGKIVGTGLQGKAKLHAPASKVVGTLALTLNVSSSDGSACDAVYQQNTTFFTDMMLGQALVVCQTCHVPAAQAAATRFHDLVTDPLATARSIALLVDTADPSLSRIIVKPEYLVPHGGGQRIVPGGTEEQILLQWIALLAAAHCD